MSALAHREGCTDERTSPLTPLLLVRLTRHMTQTELAERARLSRAHLRRLETGAWTTPSEDTVRRLAAVLGVTPTVLFPSTSEGPATNGTLDKNGDAPPT